MASPSPSAAAVSGEVRLVIDDYAHDQVRLARLDATDTATVAGRFDAIVDDQVIVVNGQNLLAMNRGGSVTKLGQLAGGPSSVGYGDSAVAVSADLQSWVYTVTDTNLTSYVHLGTPSGDTVIATVASPDGGSFHAAFAWKAGGVYMVKQGTGLGGAGAFLEYHFDLEKLDLASGQITQVSPECRAEQILDDGTLLCRNLNGSVDVRPPTGPSHAIQLSTATSGANGAYGRLSVTGDGRRVIVDRDGAQDPVINYQMAVADLSAQKAVGFGPIDFIPDSWLPDGRIVADHSCLIPQMGGGPCDSSLDGTYIFTADGASRTLFFKLAPGVRVVGYI